MYENILCALFIKTLINLLQVCVRFNQKHHLFLGEESVYCFIYSKLKKRSMHEAGLPVVLESGD